jgi:hypothetical protein
MRTQIRQHQSWAALIVASLVFPFHVQEIQAQADSSCSREGSSRSAKTTQAAKVTLTNQTKETLTVYWLDFEGKRQKWFDLSAGQAFEQPTLVGHLWLVTKPNGQCLSIFSAPGSFVIGKPQTPVNTNRPTQSQKQTTAQLNTSAGGTAQTGNAVLMVSSQPGAANPLAGAGLALFKQSFGEDLRRKGQAPAGSSAKLTPLEFWARSCLTPAGNCRPAMTEMRANSVADIMLDAGGTATMPPVPPRA